MASLYVWLKFIHLLSVGAFLFVHGITGGLSFLLRGPTSGATGQILRASQVSAGASYPALLLILITGVWMTLAGHWTGFVWPWAALVVLIVTLAAMVYVARPYYQARDAAKGSDEAVAKNLARARPQLAAAIGVVALVILFALMVFKPF